MNGIFTKKNNYLLRWLEVMGEIFHPLMLKYNEHIKFGLQDDLKKVICYTISIVATIKWFKFTKNIRTHYKAFCL
jgi:hypothetical protein